MKILKNQIQCRGCGEIIESKFEHDFVTCSCGKCSVDGGNAYLRRLAASKEGYTELSILEKINE